jgi:hypothetical protein
MATGRVVRLINGALISNSSTLLLTATTARTTILRDLAVCNTGGSSYTYDLNFVKTGESVSNANTIVKTRTIASKTTDNYRFNLPMAAGDKVYATASIANVLALSASGTEYEGTLAPFVPKRIVQSEVPSTITTVYTVDTGKCAILKDLLICNLGSGTPNFTIDVVPYGGSVSAATKWYDTYALTANQSMQLRVSAVLEAGDTIRLTAGTSNAVSININGAEWTVS